MTAGPLAPTGKIRIGFCSAHYKPRHIITEVMAGVLKHLPRDRFEVFVIHIIKDEQDPTAVSQYADHTVRILPRGLRQMQEAVAKLALDVLVYPDIGMEPLTYCLAFARLAPVQAVFCGHPVTTGIPNIDYFVSSQYFETDEADAHYSEKLVRLKSMGLHTTLNTSDPIIRPNVRQRLGLGNDDHLYACPVTLFKFQPDFDHAIARILDADPLGRFLYIAIGEPFFVPTLRNRFIRSYPHLASRLHTLPVLGIEQFKGFLQEADAVLDSFYFGGGTTAYYAFAAGAPVITLPGPYLRGRGTYAAYAAMGIPDPIAEDFDDYVAKALRLASDPAWRRDLGRRILERLPVLFEQEAYIAELADFFEAALLAKRSGLPAITFPSPNAS
jgi:protein O-GlcNAc transferase